MDCVESTVVDLCCFLWTERRSLSILVVLTVCDRIAKSVKCICNKSESVAGSNRPQHPDVNTFLKLLGTISHSAYPFIKQRVSKLKNTKNKKHTFQKKLHALNTNRVSK